MTSPRVFSGTGVPRSCSVDSFSSWGSLNSELRAHMAGVLRNGSPSDASLLQHSYSGLWQPLPPALEAQQLVDQQDQLQLMQQHEQEQQQQQQQQQLHFVHPHPHPAGTAVEETKPSGPRKSYSRGVTPEILVQFSLRPESNGRVGVTTDVLDSTELFLFLKREHSPKLTPSQFRSAVRVVLMSNRDVMPAAVWNVLRTRLDEYGMKDWGFQIRLKDKRCQDAAQQQLLLQQQQQLMQQRQLLHQRLLHEQHGVQCVLQQRVVDAQHAAPKTGGVQRTVQERRLEQQQQQQQQQQGPTAHARAFAPPPLPPVARSFGSPLSFGSSVGGFPRLVSGGPLPRKRVRAPSDAALASTAAAAAAAAGSMAGSAAASVAGAAAGAAAPAVDADALAAPDDAGDALAAGLLRSMSVSSMGNMSDMSCEHASYMDLAGLEFEFDDAHLAGPALPSLSQANLLAAAGAAGAAGPGSVAADSAMQMDDEGGIMLT